MSEYRKVDLKDYPELAAVVRGIKSGPLGANADDRELAAGLRMVADAIDPPPMVEAMREVAYTLALPKQRTLCLCGHQPTHDQDVCPFEPPESPTPSCTTCINLQNGLPHCLHFQEGDGDCCTCGKDLQHCDNCGWAGDAKAVTDPSDDANLCPECGDFICASSRTEDCRAQEAKL